MKLFTAGWATETNTFAPMPTFDASFVTQTLDEMRPAGFSGENMTGAPPPVIWDHLARERGWEVAEHPVYRFAMPSGLVVRAAYERHRDEILESLRAAMPVDAVLLALHGGSVADGYDDPEGDIITRVRVIVGPDAPIGVELDPHTNFGEGMLNASVLEFFKEYPHVDVAERAVDLFTVIIDAAEGRTKPVMAVYDCRMISIFQTPRQPLRGFIDGYSALEGRDGVLTISVCQGFPYADLPIGGAHMVVVTDGDRTGAERLARKLGDELFALRQEMQPLYLSIDEALNRALAADGRPVVIADYADNAGGGAPSDSTFILQRMLERGIENAAFAMLWDPIALGVAKEAGVGARLDLRIGGKMGPTSGDPLDLNVEVTAVVPDATATDARLGRDIKLGDVVALRCRGIDIILNTNRQQVLSTDPFTLCGIDLVERDIVVVKSSQHFYAAYSPIASEILYAYSDGALNPILQDIPYQRLPKDRLWPWNEAPFDSP
jgi:microcystin degradation protein MlrC